MNRGIACILAGGWLLIAGGCETPAPESADDSPAVAEDHAEGTAAAADHAAHDTGEGQALLPIMRQLAVEMAAMQHALWLEDYDQVEVRAAAIAQHANISEEEIARIQRVLGDEMPAFERADEVVHEASVGMHEAARARDTEALLQRLAEVQRGCVACHEQFRERLRTTQPTP